MRAFTCKDCQREVESLLRDLGEHEQNGQPDKSKIKDLRARLQSRQAQATYNENWAAALVERGGSRSDRCKDHRLKHRTNIQGMAVAYVDLETVGEVADRVNPTGPLGGLGPLPDKHGVVPATTYDLQAVNVGMTDEHVLEMIRLLREKQVLILKAGTGTGKSTFAPYRLMDPPPASLQDVPRGAAFGKLSELGQIVVTEPRVQATVGVATFVGAVMSGAGGVGPGYPVGYQVSGDRNHDEACELVYVTDGTMINWLREGRLSRIGTVIVDEAHERSTNIDFIMGYLKRELPRYPHLRVIVTSATFNTAFYQEYFGGADKANVMDVPAVKSFGYGMPMFPELDDAAHDEPEVLERWTDPALPLARSASRSMHDFVRTHWAEQWAPPFEAADVCDESDVGEREDVWNTTAKLVDLRFHGKVPQEQWKERMPGELAKFVVRLAKGLDQEGIFGDILGFLPTAKTIEPTCEEIERALGAKYRGHVFPLISTLPQDRQRRALAKRRKGDPRKIVISTNLAETSLTVEGVRFVVDSGIIAQSEWDPGLAKGGIPTKPHSQAGIKQRWGRVGRKAPGWVFPLYTKGQYLALAEDTPPGSTRENLEALVMTAKMGGIDDVVKFPWPAAFEPTTTELDDVAVAARDVFRRELARADAALRAGGAVDDDGHPTSFGKELTRFQGLGSTSSALAILYADRLACVAEVATVLSLLEDTRLAGRTGLLQDDNQWPDEWRLEAYERHSALAAMCDDDAELALLLMAAWERSDEKAAPWEPSERRQRWARRWFINDDVLLSAAVKRQDVLAALSPAMKEEVKRFVEPALVGRARAVLTRAVGAQLYRRRDGVWQGAAAGASRVVAAAQDGAVAVQEAAAATPAQIEDDQLTARSADAVIALRRRETKDDNRISNLVLACEWALPDPAASDQPTGVADAMRLVALAAVYARPDQSRTLPLRLVQSWPIGQRVLLVQEGADAAIAADVPPIPPFALPKTEGDEGRQRRRRKATSRRISGDESAATRADSDGELNLVGRRLGYRDEEQVDAAALAATDKDIPAGLACGRCFACLAGRENDCEEPAEQVGGKLTDPLQSWLAKAQAGLDVSAPRLRAADDGEIAPGWYEVVGYDLDGRSGGVRLRPDWRPEGFKGNPAQHLDVEPGQPVEVVVGPRVRHHGGGVRIFWRADGDGRFLLREASTYRGNVQEERNEIAVSLDRGSTGLLEDLVEGETLTATVVPTRVSGCYTITLLELLHQHLTRATPGRGVELHVLDTSERNAKREPVYNAVVDAPPNAHGFVTLTLLHQDTARGIRHRFTFNALKAAPAAAADAPQEPTRPSPALTGGQPVLLHLGRDYAQLSVDALDLAALKAIERSSSRQLKLIDAEPEPAPGEPDLEGERADAPVAGPDALLRSTSDKPVSRHAASALAALDGSAAWQNEVWAFWARSHHLQVDRRRPYLPGTATDVIDVRSEVELSSESPIEHRRRLVAAFAKKHPVDSVVEAEVEQITDGAVFVRLADGLDGRVPVAELSWRFTAHASDEVEPGLVLRLLVTRIDEDPPAVTLSARALVAKPYDVVKSAHALDDAVSGVVRRVTDTHVYVDLDGGAVGVAYVRDLAHVRVERASDVFAEGDGFRAAIKGFNDDREQVELSVKALLPKPYYTFKASHRIGETVLARVRKATRTNVYVELEGGSVEGAVHVRELAYDRVEDASELFGDGEEIRAAIKGFNDDRDQVELSVKALLPKPYDASKASRRIGETVDAEVTGMNKSFAYVTLPGGAEGSIHISRLSAYRIADPSQVVTKGQRIRAVILGFDDARSKVELALAPAPAATTAAPVAPARAPSVPSRLAPPVQPRHPPRSARAEGRSVEEATATAAAQLRLPVSAVTVRVIRSAETGWFGRVKKAAIVEVAEQP